jgi:aldehyde:ferredoxin oxidoreductase
MSAPGYAGRILRIDLSRGTVTELETDGYSGRFLGGRGIAAKIYWDETAPGVKALGPENCLVFITGPVAGFTRFSGCRWQICGKSPQMHPESFSYANLGGSWGAWLKYAGYDGLVVTGKAERPTYISIENDKVQIKDASYLWGKTAVETQYLLRAQLGREAKVLSIGPAGENLVSFASILAAENASGSSGFGSVMGSKKLKAIAVISRDKKRPLPADPAALKTLAEKVYRLRTQNFEDYGHILPLKTRFTACYGCISGCTRGSYEGENGKQFKVFCQAGNVYLGPAMKYNGDRGEEVNRLAERLCDENGLDTGVMSPIISWLDRCYEAGVLNDRDTGLPLSRIGSVEFVETLVRKICGRNGFGDILAQGILEAAEYVGSESQTLLNSLIMSRSGETRDHDPRLMPVNALLCAMEPRKPLQMVHATSLPLARWLNWKKGWKDAFFSTEILQHLAKGYWGSPEAGDFSTYAGKALAAKRIQDYGYVKESLILCDLAWPIYQVNSPDESLGMFTLESQLLSAITGRQLSETGLGEIGERIFNLQRAILARQGWGGRAGDNLLSYLHQEPLSVVFYDPECIVPGKDGTPVSRKSAVVDRAGFEKLKDEYYTLRGWDEATGFQTKARLVKLGLADISAELEHRKLLA